MHQDSSKHALSPPLPRKRGREQTELAAAAEPFGINGHARVICAAVVVAIICLTTLPALAAEIPLAERKSGYEFMGRETRTMQDDDTANPGMLWVLDGQAAWNRKTGTENKSCADCHGDASSSMK